MQSGKLRQRITFQLKTETQDESSGDIQEDWADDFDWWAEYQALGSREYPTAWKRNAEATGRFILRYKSSMLASNFSDSYRIAYTQDLNASPVSVKYFDIFPPIDPDGRRRQLIIEGVDVN